MPADGLPDAVHEHREVLVAAKDRHSSKLGSIACEGECRDHAGQRRRDGVNQVPVGVGNCLAGAVLLDVHLGRVGQGQKTAGFVAMRVLGDAPAVQELGEDRIGLAGALHRGIDRVGLRPGDRRHGGGRDSGGGGREGGQGDTAGDGHDDGSWFSARDRSPAATVNDGAEPEVTWAVC